MFKSKLRQNKLFFNSLFALSTTGLIGCASIGSPGGGLYDETPPVLKNSEPAEGSVHVKKQKITMHFDENIKLDRANEKITVSPPQEKAPIIMSNAKTLTIELGDSLKPNTTYSIDLGDAVQDNNEGNPLESLSLLFSTGDHIDSLQITGHLLNAYDLEPITGAYVGIYSECSSDSILLGTPFERAGKTDAYGAFKIMGCAPGTYRMYGLIDGNTNYRYDLDTENIAFIDSLISPTRDSIDVILLAFNEGRMRRYLETCDRTDSTHIAIRFATEMDSLPALNFIQKDGSIISGDSILVPETNPTCDTLTYWIKDSLFYRSDTLNITLSYMFTDTTGFDILRTDTVRLCKPIVKVSSNDNQKEDKKKAGKKRGKKDEASQDSLPKAPVITYMAINQIEGQTLEIGQRPRFETSAPLDSIQLDKLHLQYLKDTSWVEMSFHWEKDELKPRRFTLIAEPHFTPGYKYQLVVDSAAMHDIYGHPINTTTLSFKEKTPEEYAHLMFYINGVQDPAFVELLNAKDQPVQRAVIKDGQAKFVHVPAGTYYARMVIDSNENGMFDTGNLFEHRHPEQVFYLNAELQLRANWTIQQNWNPYETPLLQQKPEAIKMNKPKDKTQKKSKNEEYLRKLGKL